MSRPLPNPPPYMAPVPFNIAPVTASRTFKPSKLAPTPPPAPPTTSDGPSSPTTSSFYLASDASRSSSRPPPSRVHKSHSSVRNRPAGSNRHQQGSNGASSSSPTSLSTVHQNLRLASMRAARPPKTTRDLSLGEPVNPFEQGAYGAGGMRNGEWEEWTEEEVVGLELEGRKAKREWRARYLRGAPSSEGDLEEEPELEEQEEEPPMDILYDETDDPLLSLSHTISVPRLPSLASDPGSSSSVDDMDADMEVDSGDSQDSSTPTARPPPTAESIAVFEQALLGMSCPSCRAAEGCIKGDEKLGARCQACGWGIAMEVLRPLEAAFAGHHPNDPRRHPPLFSYTPFTGTIVLCGGCDEEFAA
ncbi:hypothetical protein BCR35DRAFT_324327 [Leucosporidium creatinivorum]|uniref:Uncharacterized protein n=1 Tax=Leucosporidium creatinivorum TaxID=106004 RepID=A0A1Y2FW62_9BASI|nr:hypothetical protein BCR35DRAFT_324327 [Leucosporidium creatinivorum]